MTNDESRIATRSRGRTIADQPPWLREVLACPRCHDIRLREAFPHLACPQCNVAYSVKNGIVSLIHPQERHAVLQEETAWRIRESACGRYEASKQASGTAQEPRHRALLEWLKELLRGQRRAQILELGAGRGWASSVLAQDGHQVVASDILEDCEIGLGCAVRQENDGGPGVAYVQCRAEALPFLDGSFDCIFCFSTLGHIADLERVLREVSRVLEPGGVFLAFDEPFRGIL